MFVSLFGKFPLNYNNFFSLFLRKLGGPRSFRYHEVNRLTFSKKEKEKKELIV